MFWFQHPCEHKYKVVSINLLCILTLQFRDFTTEDNLEWDIRPNLKYLIQVSIGSMDVLVLSTGYDMLLNSLRIQLSAFSTGTKLYVWSLGSVLFIAQICNHHRSLKLLMIHHPNMLYTSIWWSTSIGWHLFQFEWTTYNIMKYSNSLQLVTCVVLSV